MKSIPVVLLVFLLGWTPSAFAAPKFWKNGPTETPTPLPAPVPEVMEEDAPEAKATPSPPVTAPRISAATPTPTPPPGAQKLDPTLAAVLSVVAPGTGHVYAGDPLKGLAFAAVFGLGLWQTIDNFQLVPESQGSPNLVAKDETAGNLFGLVTLAAYGFGIQDAFSTAVDHNRKNHLAFRIEALPGSLRVVCLF